MSATKVHTAVKLLESLPEEAQDRVIEHLRDYIADLQDEAQWDKTFARSQKALTQAAKKAKSDIAAGKAKPLSLKRL